jgi:transposase
VFIVTLGWSRAAYVEFVTDEQLERYLAVTSGGYYFWSIPREVLYDNMRSELTDRGAPWAGLHRYNCVFLDFAHHHRFVPGCADRIGKTKG